MSFYQYKLIIPVHESHKCMLLYNLCCLISAYSYFSRHCVNLEVLATNYKKNQTRNNKSDNMIRQI